MGIQFAYTVEPPGGYIAVSNEYCFEVLRLKVVAVCHNMRAFMNTLTYAATQRATATDAKTG